MNGPHILAELCKLRISGELTGVAKRVSRIVSTAAHYYGVVWQQVWQQVRIGGMKGW
ncbi:MAG: hypothetical protein JWR01_2962 [Subtercola sp.]|nr:hypothetical protein [Subtercola sp.]